MMNDFYGYPGDPRRKPIYGHPGGGGPGPQTIRPGIGGGGGVQQTPGPQIYTGPQPGAYGGPGGPMPALEGILGNPTGGMGRASSGGGTMVPGDPGGGKDIFGHPGGGGPGPISTLDDIYKNIFGHPGGGGPGPVGIGINRGWQGNTQGILQQIIAMLMGGRA